jgi:hypothetical protein
MSQCIQKKQKIQPVFIRFTVETRNRCTSHVFIRFLPIKITKLKLCKIQKKKTKTGSNRPVSVRFSYFILETETQPTSFAYVRFFLVRFNFDTVWLGYFILKTKNYILF